MESEYWCEDMSILERVVSHNPFQTSHNFIVHVTGFALRLNFLHTHYRCAFGNM